MIPAARAREVDELARRQRDGQPLAGLLSSSSQPGSVIGAIERRRWFIAPAPSGRRCPSAPDGSPGVATSRLLRGRLLLGLLAVLDDVALLEEDALGDLAPERRPAQQELEVHAEVLVLLADARRS